MSDSRKRIRLNAHRIAPVPAALALLASGGALAQAAPDTYNTDANTPLTDNVLTNDTGTGLTVTSHTSPSHGTVTVATDGSFTYTPTNGFSGTDSFAYAETDSAMNPSNALVSITINPVINTDFATTHAGTPVSGNVLTNDIGTGLSVVQGFAPAHGTLTVAANGAFTYTPNAGFIGTDIGSYEITDSAGNITFGNAAIQITVTAAAALSTTAAPATTPVTLGLLATLLAWIGLRRRRTN